MSEIDKKLAQLNLTLPPAPKPAGLYKPMLMVGNLAYVSGHGPLQGDGKLITGRLGADMTLEQGQAAARQTGLAMLATLRAGLGSLDRVVRVVKILGHRRILGFRRTFNVAVCRWSDKFRCDAA